MGTSPSSKLLDVFHSPKQYANWYEHDEGFDLKEPMPQVSGSWSVERIAELFRDCSYDPENIESLSPDNHLPYEGKTILQDPVESHRLHPIEVVIEADVVRAMHEHARTVCKNQSGIVDPASKKETGGYLAGYLMQDDHGRCWTHIVESIHEPAVFGEADKLSMDVETTSKWGVQIKQRELINVGFWHSHPGYSPFQSDERTWGADVQSTYSECKSWWKVALVIDPFCGANNSQDMTELGAYKIVKPGLAASEEPLAFRAGNIDVIGWRSVGIAVVQGE